MSRNEKPKRSDRSSLRIQRELDATLVVVEHDLPLIMSISDRIYCLEAGQVIVEGTPEAMRVDPQVIASYLGTDERAIARSNATRTPEAAMRPGADSPGTPLPGYAQAPPLASCTSVRGLQSPASPIARVPLDQSELVVGCVLARHTTMRCSSRRGRSHRIRRPPPASSRSSAPGRPSRRWLLNITSSPQKSPTAM